MRRLTDEQITVLLKGIVQSRVQVREGMSYVEAFDIRAMMIRVFGFAGWSLVEVSPTVCVFEEKTTTKAGKDAYHVAYRAHLALIVHTDDGDATYTGSAVADSIMPDFKRADAHDMALKSAESGALKRAATNLGDQFGLSLYADGSINPVVRKVVGFTPESAPATIPREADRAGLPPAPPAGSGEESPDPADDNEVSNRLADLSPQNRTLFIKHLAMEHKVTDYLNPQYTSEVLAALDKWESK